MKEAANGDGRTPIPGYNMFSSGCPIASGHRGGRLAYPPEEFSVFGVHVQYWMLFITDAQKRERQLRAVYGQSRMFEALETLGIIWTAMILSYGSIAIFLIAARWSFRMFKRVLRKSN
jgi:hypothetical protein